MSDDAMRDLEAAGIVEPDGAELLDDVAGFLSQYVVFQSTAQVIAAALWTAHTYALDAFDVTPYLAVTSPEKRSGKSRLLDVLEVMVARPWRAVTPSEAVVYRKVQADKPTLLLDEVDAIFRKGEREELRALLNAGYQRGLTVPRIVGDGKNMKVQDFETFCAKAIAGIGLLPDTVSDRSIPIRLQRRKRTEVVAKFRRRDVEPNARALRERLQSWAQDAIARLTEARPHVPEALDDRAADGWEALLAIADLVGKDWPGRARRAAHELHGAQEEDDSLGGLLLAHVREAFALEDTDRMSTEELLRTLIDNDAGPWAAWWERAIGEGNTRGPGSRLARLLGEFEIRSTKIRIEDKSVRGYLRIDFEDAFGRYLGPVPSSRPEKSEQWNSAGQGPDSAIFEGEPKTPKTGSEQGCSDVPSETPEERERADPWVFPGGLAPCFACGTAARSYHRDYEARGWLHPKCLDRAKEVAAS